MITSTSECQVYQITNKLDGKQYIGVSKNAHKRFIYHCNNRKLKSRSYIRDAIQKHGRDNFEFKLLFIAPRRYCLEMESKLITAYGTLVPNGYNICGGGESQVATLDGERSYWYGKKRDPDSVERSRMNNSGEKNYKAKKFIATSPDGVEHTGISLSLFSKKHNLNVRNLSQVGLGRRKHHLGWTVKYVEEVVS